MKKKAVLLSAVVIVVLSFLTACGGASPTAKVDLGVMDKGTYKNDYFGLEMQVSEAWSIQDAEAMNEIMEIGKEIAAGDDEKKKKQLDLGDEKTLNFVMAFKYPPEQQQPINPSIICNAEKLSFLQGVKTGEDYLESAKNMMTESQMPYKFDKEIYTEKIGGKDFDIMEAVVEIGDMKIMQKYHTSIMKDYALNFIVTYFDDESKAEIDTILDSIRFE
ncbi:hypothetical protein [Geosporobacter ferrireducens]|uniref:Lipoprotein n=1 Tax=Geosporobacter ferrireducens TaxID=1424294 RepID=A0A1D8GEF9_9FIRM|nr:hypothetical protein [Geosporobacter ferrireducens]AOT69296.1 hypothetical protein Gferi_06760 [Geosporobacter ferrireducens]MTI56979.1 hypothetical protein [Geosporobacter ferrireducens]